MPSLDGPPHDLPRLIEVLERHEVEYLIVGGAAAYAYGAERPTEDADCVVRRDRANLDRLAGALREMHARLRVGGMSDAEAKRLPVQIDATALNMAGMSTWMTDAGACDVLAGLEAPDGQLVPYDELAERAGVLQGDGFVIRVASLEDIIRAKERADRPKDREALPELRALRDARRGADSEA
jgi:predicted nucleotidyltransferase